MQRDELSKDFSLSIFKNLVTGLVDAELYSESKDIQHNSNVIKSAQNIGHFLDNRFNNVLVLTHSATVSARVKLATDTFRLMAENNIDKALVAYVSTKEEQVWRLSFISISLDEVKGRIKKTFSNPKRYSFILGPEAKTLTPYQYLIQKGQVSNIEELQKRFSLEVVNNEFYREIAKLYDELVGTEKTERLLKHPSTGDESHEFAVRLIGRIIFCWFLREKKSNEGLPLIPDEVLSRDASTTDNYYHNTLAPLFFEVLNKPIENRTARFANDGFSKIPYLNGGLFSNDDIDSYRFDKDLEMSVPGLVNVPDEWLRKLFDLLERFNFTVDENTSFDTDLSIDPEMLGRVFENLLARINPETGETVRKSTGSFYTPREIVDYMVDSSLVEYLREATNVSRNKLEALVSYNLLDDKGNELNKTESESVLLALSTLTVIDPACGSGAFPIGMLQKIVFVVSILDPEAKWWLAKQLQGATPELRREFENKGVDYIRKLGVIRQTIYGVDIQPIATEISRLRCFLTLVVDEVIDDSQKNRGIRPLPNLEFKFVTANTLLPLPEQRFRSGHIQQDIFDNSQQTKIDKLRFLIDEFFSASASEKSEIKAEYRYVQNQLWNDMHRSSAYGQQSLALTGWDPFEHTPSAWFDQEWMFGIKEGFDIVIGNPPYMSALKSVKDNAENRNSYRLLYKELSGAFDLYAAFLLRGLQLMKTKGVYSWIIPNKLTVASYAQGTYKLLKEQGLISIVSVSMAKVFDASVYPVVIIGMKNNQPCITKEYVVDDLGKLGSTLESNENTMLSDGRFKLIGNSKIKLSSGTTGFQAQLLNRYLSDRPGMNRIPFTVSGCIDPYTLLEKPVRYMGKTYEKAFIEKNGNEIAESKWKLWENEKVVIAGMTKRIEAVFVDEPLAIGVGTYAIYDFGGYDSYSILALLNSRFLTYYVRNKFKAKHLAGGYLAINKSTIEQLPLPSADTSDRRLKELSDLAQLRSKQNSDMEKIHDIEVEIDNIVFDLYRLSESEIEAVINDPTN